MNFKKLSTSLLARIVVAIILGVITSQFFPTGLARVFITFNSLFGNFLGFFVPVLIFALITPAIAGLGSGAGKWLGLTAGIAYISTVLSGTLAYVTARVVYPWLLGDQTVNSVSDIDEGALTSYFNIEIDPPFGVMTALILAFCFGVAMTTVKSDNLYKVSREVESVVMKVISGFVIPLLPVFIYGMFLGLGMNGNLQDTFISFGKVLVLAIIGTFVFLIFQFALAGIIAKTNPIKAFANMLPAYATALGTSSSAATIPITYAAALRNGVEKNVAGFAVPLCATIHLAGSMMKIMLFAFAIVYMEHIDVPVGLAIGFMLMLGITMIAAPGVPGGAIMAAVGLLASMLGFDESQVALMIAAYIAIDSFGTAANVTGDGALALIINRFAAGKIKPADLAEVPGVDAVPASAEADTAGTAAPANISAYSKGALHSSAAQAAGSRRIPGSTSDETFVVFDEVEP
ncbi:dicarboxylate/amino acid:cation symporter [Corynebacterium caspium]|uniref:dicarboxylate/amino acid:cation symporter n=1 Tax=Corynebacterium caspium TaxID=234828 RepID=UPI00037A447C|nr:dicarboxylate/amino acid:cation symporter [Corynebacterium caspium]WKD60039.1 C4-dicarboxylate transporter DctA [Corynebacterium caspium DSM 44850]